MGAVGEPAKGAGRDVEDPDVGRRRRAGADEGERSPILREIEPARDLGGQLRTRRDAARREVVQLELAFPGDVPEEGRAGAALVDLEAVELGVLSRHEDLD